MQIVTNLFNFKTTYAFLVLSGAAKDLFDG